MTRAIEKALRKAQLHPSEIDYINAHGTATEDNDLVETRAIKKALGQPAYRVAISSTKPVTGHLLAAAGAIETLVCILSIHHSIIPPTLNLHHPEADCDLDYVPGKARPFPIRNALNLNVGFGGKNSCLVISKFNGS